MLNAYAAWEYRQANCWGIKGWCTAAFTISLASATGAA